MIVKVWPIKADYASNPGKVGGLAGLKNAVDYIADPEKTGALDERTVRKIQIETQDMRKNSYINREKDLQKVIRYMANEDKIEEKLVSGYHCSPELAVSEFQRVMTHYGKQAKGNIAYHMVQSFPEDLDISDEEVHACGLELCEKLKLYQAVVCSHVHPVLDDEGVMHGVCKHNHILFNAYPLPSLRDPDAKGPLKYHDCKASYRQLQIWNDEIAIEHGLPIIRTPDLERTYSWSETEAANKGVSWKERIRSDIENAKKATSNWNEFVAYMADMKYRIRDGKQVTYIAPDGKHRARGNTLGRAYTKEDMEVYWHLREEMLKNIDAEVDSNASPSLSELRHLGAATVAIPLGAKGKKEQGIYQLSFDREQLSQDALYTYFEPKQLYDVYDEDGRIMGAVSGEETIAYYLNRDSDRERNKRAAEQEEENEQTETIRRHQSEQEDEKKKSYYSNALFQNSRSNKPYKIRFYDASGRRISSLEAMFILAVVVLKNEDGLWLPSTVPPDKMNEACYATTNWKIQNMLDSVQLAREEHIETPADVARRLDSTGAAYSRARASLRRNTHVKEKMEDLKAAVVAYEKNKDLVEAVYNMPDGEEKSLMLKEYAEELNRYKEAVAVMYAHGFHKGRFEAEIIDFKKRWRHVEDNLQAATQQYNEARESYRKLKKLQYNMALAQNTKYCYGPEYDVKKRTHEQDNMQRTGRNPKPEQTKGS